MEIIKIMGIIKIRILEFKGFKRIKKTMGIKQCPPNA